ncbi:MAG: MBL fold metallo-hydrolase [Actinomycetota bacterium]|nr:MBL fold metallo-hydrolase [Actinomycetota bacterium]
MYTGNVKVGGSADVHELPKLIVSKLAVGPYNNNAYLLRCRRTGAQVLIDAPSEANRLLTLIGTDGVGTVITTHSHHDHWGALAEVVAATGAQTAAHLLDAPDIPVPTDLLLADQDLLTFGDCTLLAIHLVGHTPGSIALLYQDPDGPPHLFTGDCLFPGGVGNTEKDAARFNSLIGDVTSKLFDRLPDETWVYPGHGHDTTIGNERPELASWLERGW